MLQSFHPQHCPATLPPILGNGGQVHQVSLWLMSWLTRWWLAQCRRAECANRFVPRY